MNLRLESNAFDQSDYLMFVMNLFNGYSGFDIVNIDQVTKVNDQFIVDYDRFKGQLKLCEVNCHIKYNMTLIILVLIFTTF